MVASKTMGWIFVAAALGAVATVFATQPRRARRAESDRVDEESEDSFPASDPPSFSADTGAQAVPGPTS
jgi:hypothetical protein